MQHIHLHISMYIHTPSHIYIHLHTYAYHKPLVAGLQSETWEKKTKTKTKNQEPLTGRHEHILRSRMPGDEADPFLVSPEVDNGLSQVGDQATVRDLPHLDCAVIGGTSHHVVIVGAPLDVQHRSLVTCHLRAVDGHSTHLYTHVDRNAHTHTHTHAHIHTHAHTHARIHKFNK